MSKREQIAELLAKEFSGATEPEETPEEMPVESASDADVEVTPDEEPVETTEEPEEGGDLPDTLPGLAEAINADADYLYSVKVGLGETGEQVPIGELKDRLQASERALRELQAKPEEPIQAPVVNEHQQAFAQAKQEHDQLQKNWAAAQQSEDWAKLVQEEPARAMLYMQQYQMEKQRLEGVAAAAQGQLKAERAKMMDETVRLIPEWQDSNVMNVERRALAQWLQESEGIPANRVMGETDPRVIRRWRKDWKMETSAQTPKPVKPIKPVAAKPKTSQRMTERKILEAGRKATGNRAKATAIAELMKLNARRTR